MNSGYKLINKVNPPAESGQRGAVFVESILPLLIFLVLIVGILEVCRVIYISLSFQFIVATTAREIVRVGQVPPNPANPAACCNDRVALIRQRANEFASSYLSVDGGGPADNMIGFNAATDLQICDARNAADCNICDANGPGFVRNRILILRAQRNLRFLLLPGGYVNRPLQRISLAKIEANVQDCR